MASLRNVGKNDLYHTKARWGDGVIDYYTGTVRDRETKELLAIVDVYDLGDKTLATVTNVFEGLTQHFGESEGSDGLRDMQRYVMCHFPNKYCVLKAELV